MDLIDNIEFLYDKENYSQIIELTNDLDIPLFSDTKTSFYVNLWRHRATSLRELKKIDEAIECYFIALALSYSDPLFGEFTREFIWGQLSYSLQLKDEEGSFLLNFINARKALPFKIILKQGKVKDFPEFDKIRSKNEKEYQKINKLRIYDYTNILVDETAIFGFISEAKRLAEIGLQDAIVSNNIRGQILLNVQLSRFEWLNQNTEKEEEYYNEAETLSKGLYDMRIKHWLSLRKRKFVNLRNTK
jgi:hypothetical protein